MSDIPVVEITTPRNTSFVADKSFSELLKQQQADAAYDAKHTKTVEVEEEPAEPEGKPLQKWVRTRQCWCPKDAATDCRFHSRKEPGWEVCPSKNSPNRSEGRWLWASIGETTSGEGADDITEDVPLQ